MSNNKKIYVVGHKNPDTDSVCSAIAYADFKSKLTGLNYEPRRAGELNGETAYVLDYFGVKEPKLLENVHHQVRDLDIQRTEGVSGHVSIKCAWERMKEENIATLPVTRDNRLEGVITSGDIAESYMNVYDSHALSTARTRYKTIVDVLDGKLITGNEHSYFLNGKVVVAASDEEHMEKVIEQDDLVILGNQRKLQMCAVRQNASCVVICQEEDIDEEIVKKAQEKQITIIQTRHGIFNVARLINQSIPVRYFMTEKDKLVVFRPNEYLEDVKEVMAKNKFRDFPVINKQGDFEGFISRHRLMTMRKIQLVLVDHNEKSQAVEGIEDAEILEIIDHHRIGNLETVGPVYFRNQPVGCTATIIYQMYLEHHMEMEAKIAGILCSAILSDTLLFRSPTCTPVDEMAARAMAQIAGIDVEEHATHMFQEGSNLRGKTTEEICFQDFKVFNIKDTMFGIGQLTFLSKDEMQTIKERLEDYLETARQSQSLDMVFVMLTNILEESTELLCCGQGARKLALDAFDLPDDTETIYLKGVVSRKKQMMPTLASAIQQN